MKHDLFKSGDADAPRSILDRNGEVTLGLCRQCGEGEAGLAEECPGPIRTCALCGCTNFNACPGGCYWLIATRHGRPADVCSDHSDATLYAAGFTVQRLPELEQTVRWSER